MANFVELFGGTLLCKEGNVAAKVLLCQQPELSPTPIGSSADRLPLPSEKHSTPTSKPRVCLAKDLHMVHGEYYDLMEFQHPGGPLVLSQSRGMDITASAMSHHLSEQWTQVLAKARKARQKGQPFDGIANHRGVAWVPHSAVVGTIEPCGYSFESTGLFHATKTAVKQQLLETHGNLRPRPTVYYSAHVFMIAFVYLSCWYRCCFCFFFTSSITAWTTSMLPLLVAIPNRIALVGIAHESVHGRSPCFGEWFNRIVDRISPFSGGVTGNFLWHLFDAMLAFPSEKWHYEHCLLHHPHTKRFPETGENGHGHGKGDAKTFQPFDPDETLAFLRLNEKTAWRWVPHRAQVLWQLLISTLFSLVTYIEHQVIPQATTLVPSTVFICLFQFLPIFTHPDGKLVGLKVAAFVVMLSNAITLHCLHVSHLNEHCAEKQYSFNQTGAVDWGEHQVRTTCNWVPGSLSLAAVGLPHIKYSYGLTGMLELQIEHHLFPALPYEVQQEIAPLVRATAEKFGVAYNEFPGLVAGLRAHWAFMQELGKGD